MNTTNFTDERGWKLNQNFVLTVEAAALVSVEVRNRRQTIADDVTPNELGVTAY
jgi:hypothetical protein